jgi:hypothetical protein
VVRAGSELPVSGTVLVQQGATASTLEFVGEIIPLNKTELARVIAQGAPTSGPATTRATIVEGAVTLQLKGGPITIPANELPPDPGMLIRHGQNTTLVLRDPLPATGLTSPIPSPFPTSTNPAPSLPAPRIVQVEVVQQNPGNEVRVVLGGREVPAKSASPLNVGGRYLMQVERHGTEMILRPVPPGDVSTKELALAILRGSLSKTPVTEATRSVISQLPAVLASTPEYQPVKAHLQRLQSTLESILPKVDSPPTADQLRTFVQDSGMKYEAKLASEVPHRNTVPQNPQSSTDLKGTLLNTLREPFAPVIEAPGFVDSVRQLVESIEANQALNVLSKFDGQGLQIHVPLPMTDAWTTLHLAINPEDSPDATDASERSYHIMMHVEMSELGNTWIDGRIEGRTLRGVFYIENPQGRTRMLAGVPELRDSLLGAGFASVVLSVRAPHEFAPEDRSKFAALELGHPATIPLLDIQA